MLKQVMKRAWELAKQGVTKFGGKVRQYFAVALSIAWKEIKSMSNFNPESVMAIGAKSGVVYIAIPADVEVRVLNAVDIVKKAVKKVANKAGVAHNVFEIEAGALHAPFNVLVDGAKHNFEVVLAERKINYNGVK